MIFRLVHVVPKYENSATGWYIFVKKNVDGICGCENPKIVSGKSMLIICMSVCVLGVSTLYEILHSKQFNLETGNFIQTFSKALISVLNPKVWIRIVCLLPYEE